MNKTLRTAVLTALAGALSVSTAFAAATTYRIDPVHSTVGFTVKHLFGKVNGQFNTFEGTFVYDADKVENSTVDVTVQTASISTVNDMRDKHLRSPDFFDAEKYPTLTFKSTKVTGTKDAFNIEGNLTMRGVTKPVTLTASFLGSGAGMENPPKTHAGFEASSKVNRKDYGISWSKTLDQGTLVVGDDVEIRISVEAVAQ